MEDSVLMKRVSTSKDQGGGSKFTNVQPVVNRGRREDRKGWGN